MKAYWIPLFAGLAACSGAAEVPDTPDLSELQSEYERPTGLLDLTSVNEVLAEIPELGRLSSGFRAAGYATRGVNEAADTSAKKESSIRLQGSIRVGLRCPGDAASPVFDADTNGSMSLTLAVENNAIKRGVGGRADGCVLRADVRGTPLRVEIDGPIAFDLGGDLSLRQRWSGRLLMRIAGTITIGDLELQSLSARFTNSKFEYLFVLPNDDWIIAELTDQGVALRDREQTWVCPDGQPCALF
ncbi:MAG TPA: hypothetical protein VFZ53_12595 [Polyangiaceae bacterium]